MIDLAYWLDGPTSQMMGYREFAKRWGWPSDTPARKIFEEIGLLKKYDRKAAKARAINDAQLRADDARRRAKPPEYLIESKGLRAATRNYAQLRAVSPYQPRATYFRLKTSEEECDTHAHAREAQEEPGQQKPTLHSAVESSGEAGGVGDNPTFPTHTPPVPPTSGAPASGVAASSVLLPDGSVLVDPASVVTTVARLYHWSDDNLPVLEAWVETHENRAPRSHDLRELGTLIGEHGVNRVTSGIRVMGDNGQFALKHLKTWLAAPEATASPRDLGFHSYAEMEQLTMPRNHGQEYWQQCQPYRWQGPDGRPEVYFWPPDKPLPPLTADYQRIES